MGVLPGAEPFAVDGGEVGVVFSHGFTGSPQSLPPRSLRPRAEDLAAAGPTVRPPDHGGRRRPLHDAPATFAGSLEFARAHTSAPAAG